MKRIKAHTSALFLDIDGTLLDIASAPKRVVVPPSFVTLLGAVHDAFGGALAIVTGRNIATADELLAPLRLPASGVHGCELRIGAGEIVTLPAPDVCTALMPQLRELGRSLPGVLIEPKGLGVAIHYRLQPLLAAEIKARLLDLVKALPFAAQLIAGRLVYEILPAGPSKATGVEALLKNQPFSGRQPVMIGDDRGDIPAFDFVTKKGGIALKVGGEHFSAEEAHFNDPGSVRSWLETFVPRSADISANSGTCPNPNAG